MNQWQALIIADSHIWALPIQKTKVWTQKSLWRIALRVILVKEVREVEKILEKWKETAPNAAHSIVT